MKHIIASFRCSGCCFCCIVVLIFINNTSAWIYFCTFFIIMRLLWSAKN